MDTLPLPHAYSRRVLLAVTGLSPQILTETLYALAVAQTPAFVPTEVHLITTTEGARLARAALLHPDGGQFHALCADYPVIRQTRFDESSIHIIGADTATPLADIRTPQENALAADAITAWVAKLTADADSALHVSIAGGRKTMGFYLGYAFSLFARAQDRLSHVLVSEPFESHPEFFYPPRQPRRLTTRDGRHIDSAEARVTLAEIPVVHMRHGLPVELQTGAVGFNQAVGVIQDRMAPAQLEIDLTHRTVRCGNRRLTLKPQLLAWFAWWAWLRKTGRGDGAGFVSWRTASADTPTFLKFYSMVVGVDAAAYEKTRSLLLNGMDEKFFQEKNAKLERALKTALGSESSPYLQTQLGKRPHTRRGLLLPTEAIFLPGLPTQP